MKNRFAIFTELSIPLLVGVAIALLWANIAPQSYQIFLHTELVPFVTFDYFVNAIFMVFFFATACVEITTSLLPGGHLNPIKTAMTPLMATLGGVVGPILVFICLNTWIGAPEYSSGWAIPTATDIAVSWLAARFIFGSVHPAISFLLLLAIADDAIGLIIIAIFYPNPLAPVEPMWLLLVALAMLLAWLFKSRFRFNSYWPYLLICGVISWIGMSNANLHPALSLVFVIPFIPHKCQNNCSFPISASDCRCKSPLVNFENDFKPLVDFGLFFFGLANAGVQFTSLSALTWIVFFSLFIGKTMGVFGMAKIATYFGLPLPKGINNKELFVLSMIASIGLTVALFVAGVAYVEPDLVCSAKMGALFSMFIAGIAFIIARLLNIRPPAKQLKQLAN